MRLSACRALSHSPGNNCPRPVVLIKYIKPNCSNGARRFLIYFHVWKHLFFHEENRFRKRVRLAQSEAASNRGRGINVRLKRTVLVLLAVTVALKLFCHHLTGAAVKFFIDNRSVLGSLRKGRSKVEDLNSLVLMTIDKTVHIDQCLFSWIPSKLNLADLPSRGQLITDITTVDCAAVVRSLIDELRNSMRASQVTAKQCMDTVAARSLDITGNTFGPKAAVFLCCIIGGRSQPRSLKR